jgi:hypothetical protein
MFIFIKSQIGSQNYLLHQYYLLASLYCHIDDYPIWLEQQSRLKNFLQYAQFFDYDTDRLNKQLEQYRLQRECLRAVERLPVGRR